MEVINNIISLKSSDTLTFPLKSKESKEEICREDMEGLILSLQRVLDDIEEMWEMDHNAVELRYKLCVLRCYLEYINKYSNNCNFS